jgi:hypothetical protein
LIVRSLEIRLLESGPAILGSQLGLLINQAISPLSCREFGGLKEFVDAHLSQVVRGLGVPADGHDYHYQILLEPHAAKAAVPVPDHLLEVVGDDLWRFFSNPNLACALAVSASGTVLAAPSADLLPTEAVELRRMQAVDYQQWAEEFAAAHSLVAEYQQAAAADDFYKVWIPLLRKAVKGPTNFLKSWETLRTEKVAHQLANELMQAQVESSRVAEIVRLARPVGRPARTHAPVHSSSSLQLELPRFRMATEASVTTEAGELAQLRRLLHLALDVMSLEELREVRVSAGAWMKISDKSHM